MTNKGHDLTGAIIWCAGSMGAVHTISSTCCDIVIPNRSLLWSVAELSLHATSCYQTIGHFSSYYLKKNFSWVRNKVPNDKVMVLDLCHPLIAIFTFSAFNTRPAKPLSNLVLINNHNLLTLSLCLQHHSLAITQCWDHLLERRVNAVRIRLWCLASMTRAW
jgi:hypothetical protein